MQKEVFENLSVIPSNINLAGAEIELIGVEEKEESVNFLIESNMDSLMRAEEKSYIQKGALSSLFQFLPLLCVSLGMLIYCIAIILVSLSHISSLFQ